MSNPFESDSAAYLVLANDEDQHSLWPADLHIPPGWGAVYGPGERAQCLAYVDEHWSDMRPRTLRVLEDSTVSGTTDQAR